MTVQIKDKLDYNGKVYSLDPQLLQDYFSENPKQTPGGGGGKTALYRGYIGHLSIKNEALFVKDILIRDNRIQVNLILKSVLKKCFPEDRQCSWFSGLIELNETVDEAADTKILNAHRYLEIYKGYLIGERSFTIDELREFKKDQFEKYKNSEAYTVFFNRIMKSNIGIEKTNQLILENILTTLKEVL